MCETKRKVVKNLSSDDDFRYSSYQLCTYTYTLPNLPFTKYYRSLSRERDVQDELLQIGARRDSLAVGRRQWHSS